MRDRGEAAAWRRYARLTGPDARADVDDEMEFHLQALADQYEARGHSREEARAMAIREFGDRERAREECVRIDTTSRRGSERTDWLGTLWQDTRHGARRLLKNPVFSIVAVLTLAIGIGPNVAIFSIINSVLLKPLPFAHPEQLVLIQETFPVPGGQMGNGSVSYSNYLDWKAQSRSFDMAIASFAGSANFQGDGEPERLSVAAVGSDAFSILGAHPLLGRSFTAEEGVPNGPQVVILSEGFWRRRFSADPNILGRKVNLDGTPYAVVGVMPSETTFPNRTVPIDAWQPLQVQVTPNSRGSHAFSVIGRLKPGATLAGATTEMKQIAARLADLYPAAQEKRSVALTPYREAIVGSVQKQLVILLGAAALVLLIACANAASLLLARAAARQREVAVLAALGASRARVAQQFLVESLLLSLCGGVLGFALSRVAVKAIIAGAGNSLPRSTQIHFDWRVIAFVAGTVLFTTIVFGLVPALQATKTNLQDTLRSGGRAGASKGTGMFRSALVVGQFALSLMLLAGAGLLLRTFASLLGTPTGMTTSHVLTLHIPFPLGSPKYKTPVEALSRFYDPMMQRVRALPGVQDAGMINLLPLQQWGNNGNFAIAGKSYASVSEKPFAEFRVAGPGYFSTLGIPLLRGRGPLATDVATGDQVVVINEALAKKFFPGEDPVNRSLLFGQPGPTNPTVTIVGVVGSVRQSGIDREPQPELYLPVSQAGGSLANMTLVVRTAMDPSQITKSVVGAIQAIDPAQPVFNIKTMDDVVRGSVADRRLYLGLLGTFAGVALALAIAGIYGVMSYGVSQRTREFGIRLALGSETARVQRLVVWQGARLALLGLVIGLPAAFVATRLLGSVLYGVGTGDPGTFLAVGMLLGGVSLVASYLPARRVARVDPIVAMRAE